MGVELVTLTDSAERLGVSRMSLHRAVKSNKYVSSKTSAGISIHWENGKPVLASSAVHFCQGCGTDFIPEKSNVRYCDRCRVEGTSYICVTCGKPVPVSSKVHAAYAADKDFIWACKSCKLQSEEHKENLREAHKRRLEKDPKAYADCYKNITDKLVEYNKTEEAKQQRELRSTEFQGSVEHNEMGKKYGSLNVLSYAGSRKESALWLCECSCGRKHTYTGTQLRKLGVGYVCNHAEKWVGVKFGDYTISKKANKSGDYAGACICGVKVVRPLAWFQSKVDFICTHSVNGIEQRLCKGCENLFEATDVSNYCGTCLANGVSYVCETCGKTITITVRTHRIYTLRDDYVWQCKDCSDKSDTRKQSCCIAATRFWDSVPLDSPLRQVVAERLAAGKTPEVELRRLQTLRSSDAREMKRQIALKQYEDPAQCERASKHFKVLWSTPEYQAKMAVISDAKWKKGSVSHTKAVASHKELWKDKNYREQMVRALGNAARSPEGRQSRRLYWANPKLRASMSKTRLNTIANTPLSEENYELIQQALDLYSGTDGLLCRLSVLGAVQAVKHIRENARNGAMWQTIVNEIKETQPDVGCRMLDLTKVTGYSFSHISKMCSSLKLENITYGYTGLQMDVTGFMRTAYAGNVVVNKRYDFLRNKKGNKMELDIYIPEHKLAIEVNGTYWHSTANEHIDKNYHYMKSKLCRDNGIRLIHVWEHEWYDERQRPILEAMLLSALGQSKRVSARKLAIEVRPSKTMREFFDTNNIQGFRGGQFAVCLVDPNTREVLMAYNIGKGAHMSRGYQFEVVRGASKLGYTVVGGSSRLLKYLMRMSDIEQLVYYIDYNYFDGRSLKDGANWEYKGAVKSFKNFWVKEGVVKNREPKRHKEITEKYKTGEVLQLWNAGVATYVYNKVNP